MTSDVAELKCMTAVCQHSCFLLFMHLSVIQGDPVGFEQEILLRGKSVAFLFFSLRVSPTVSIGYNHVQEYIKNKSWSKQFVLGYVFSTKPCKNIILLWRSVNRSNGHCHAPENQHNCNAGKSNHNFYFLVQWSPFIRATDKRTLQL